VIVRGFMSSALVRSALSRLAVLAIAAPLMTAAISCHPPARNSSAETAPDSLTGTVSITGTSFEQQLVLRSGDSVIYLSAAAADSAALSRMGGVEVVVRGKRTANSFRVERFAALRVAGSPVADGVIRNDGGKLLLETGQGRIPLGNPPDALRGMVGARVWIGGPLDSGPNVYGLIVPPL
jgi:hypothetical protein